MFFNKWMKTDLAHKIRLSHVLDAVADSMIVVDDKGKIILANRQTINLFGYQEKELLGKAVEILVPKKIQRKHVSLRDQYYKSPQARMMDPKRNLAGLKKDGSEVPLDISLTPIKIDNKTYIVTSMRDITERKQNEKIKDEFIAVGSHELRTPLTSMKGALDLIEHDIEAFPKNMLPILNILRSNTEKLIFLINDLLDIQKISSGALTVQPQQQSLLAIIKKAVEDNKLYAEKQNISCKITTGEKDCIANVDAARICQIIDNLVSNAIKFSPDNAVVELGLKVNADEVCIFVKDSGTGIPDEFIPFLFKKFSQANTGTTRKYKGTGLGLFLVKQITELHGGKITFETSSKGTTFLVTLPL